MGNQLLGKLDLNGWPPVIIELFILLGVKSHVFCHRGTIWFKSRLTWSCWEVHNTQYICPVLSSETTQKYDFQDSGGSVSDQELYIFFLCGWYLVDVTKSCSPYPTDHSHSLCSSMVFHIFTLSIRMQKITPLQYSCILTKMPSTHPCNFWVILPF